MNCEWFAYVQMKLKCTQYDVDHDVKSDTSQK